MIRPYIKTFAFIATVTYFVACSPVKFDKSPLPTDCQNVGGQAACIQSCDASGSCFADYEIKEQVGKGVVDILFIDDNSGSMSRDQANMASHFPNFINSIQNLNYHLAITSTDVTGLDTNSMVGSNGSTPNYPGKNGTFIDFGNGAGNYITPATPNGNGLFAAQIQRQETLNCESSGFSSSVCPSDDERGIYAAYAGTIYHGSDSGTDGSFIRQNGEMDVIILSNEDVRSSVYCDGKPSSAIGVTCLPQFNLKPQDIAANFIADFKAHYPSKTLVVHSIVVKDSNCVQAQQNAFSGTPGIVSEIGTQYINLSNMTRGVVGDICASDYGAQLSQIGNQIATQATNIQLSCVPYNNYSLTITPPGGSSRPAVEGVDYTRNNLEIDFSTSLSPGTQIDLSYKCKLN